MEGSGDEGNMSISSLMVKPSVQWSSPPPLSAIDRFLLSSNQRKTEEEEEGCLFGALSCIPWAGGDHDDCSQLDQQEIRRFVDGLFVDDITSNYSNNNNNNNGLVMVKKKKKIKKGNYKVQSGGNKRSSAAAVALIKGQWTDEEDRELIKLVKEYGERKWAQIAFKLHGRAGKQCRERWHNHLRPDIKRDRWSEAEERLLVEGHRRVGNRWAEIGKSIPGRTENAIKNHWNATKRRQATSRRASKHTTATTTSSTVLEEYMKNNNILDDDDQEVVGAAAPSPSPPDMMIPYSVDDHLQVAFDTTTSDHDLGVSSDIDHQDACSLQLINSSLCSSDLYLAYLLNGSDNSNYTPSSSASGSSSSSIDLITRAAGREHHDSAANGSLIMRKEMDLIEMLSSYTNPN